MTELKEVVLSFCWIALNYTLPFSCALLTQVAETNNKADSHKSSVGYFYFLPTNNNFRSHHLSFGILPLQYTRCLFSSLAIVNHIDEQLRLNRNIIYGKNCCSSHCSLDSRASPQKKSLHSLTN